MPLRLDVTDRAADFAAVQAAHEYFGQLDVIVNNAGYGFGAIAVLDSRFTSLWEFEQEGRSFQVRVDGSLIFNDSDLILAAALAGQGIGYLFEDQIVELVAEGRLIQVLAEWCPTAPGYYLYHPNRRQMPPALAALIDALRISSDDEQQ